MPNTRDENISRIWARNANTTIPASPTSGASYRNTGLTDGQKDIGYMFDRVASSADTNQLLYLVTAILQHLEQRGIAGWSNAVDYVVGALTLGSDGEVYQAARASGPGAGAGIGARDPVTEGNRPTYWGSFTELFGNVPETRRINAGTGLEGGGDLSEDRTLAVRFASRLEVELGNELATAISPGRLRTELNTQFANRDIIAGTGLEGGGNLSTDREIGISDGGVDTDQLANGAVTEPKISTGAITTAKIVDNAVTTAKINSRSINSTHIALGTITGGNIASGGILKSNLDDGIFASQSVTNQGTADDCAVTPLTLAGRLRTGTNTQSANSDIIAGTGLEGGGNLSTDVEIGISDGGVDTDQLANGAVTEPKISTGAITTAKIVDNAVTTAKINSRSINSTHIALGTITGGNIASGGILKSNLDDGIFASQSVTNQGTADDCAVSPLTLAGRLPSGGFLGNIVTFNNSGTYNAPSGLVRIVVDIWGGGGEGGGSNGAGGSTGTAVAGGGGGGGGGGGYVRVEVMAADIPTGNIPVTVARTQSATVFNSNDGAGRGGNGSAAGAGSAAGIGGAGGSGGTTGAAGGSGGNGASDFSNRGGGGAGGGGATAGGLGTVLIRQAGQNGENGTRVDGGDGGTAGGNGGGRGGQGATEDFNSNVSGQNSLGQGNNGNDGDSPGGGGGGSGGGQRRFNDTGQDGGHPGNAGYGRVVIYEYY